jgi:mono/diheme cytochrome c family protein
MKSLLSLTACAVLAASQAAKNPYQGSPQAVRAGAKLFARYCAPCHGRGAEGIGRAPDLRSHAVQGARGEALFDILTNGVMRRGMPSWAHLPEQQRWQIVTYLKSLDQKAGAAR